MKMQMTITALGVGHGDATLLRYLDPEVDTSWTCLVDGGESAETLSRRLQEHGVDKIDLLVNTHADHDHIGGLARLSETVTVAEYWGPALPAFRRHAWLFGERTRQVLDRCSELEGSLDAAIVYPLEGYTSQPCGVGGPRIHVLSPATRLVRHLLTENDVSQLFISHPMPLGWLTRPEERPPEDSPNVDALDDAIRNGSLTPDSIPEPLRQPLDGDEMHREALAHEWAKSAAQGAEFFGDSVLNNTSLVLWIEVPIGPRRYSVLLTGDQENWTYLLFRNPRGLHADVYKASHHGGRVYLEGDEAHEEVMAAIRPRAVLMSANGRHGLPRNIVRDAAVRWGATVVCTSHRDRDTIIGLDSPFKCCHRSFQCKKKTRDAGIVMDATGIHANVRACHTGTGPDLGPVIQVTQHLLEPSPIVGRIFEQELRNHVRWIKKQLKDLAQEARSTRGGELAGGNTPITTGQLLALAPASRQTVLRAHMKEILQAGSARGQFWAVGPNRWGHGAWRLWELPGKDIIETILSDLGKKVLIVFSQAGERTQLGRNGIVSKLPTEGLASHADRLVGLPTEVFDDTVWPHVVREFLRDGWHCYKLTSKYDRYHDVLRHDLAMSRHCTRQSFLSALANAAFRPGEQRGIFEIGEDDLAPGGFVLVSGLSEDSRNTRYDRVKAGNRWLLKIDWDNMLEAQQEEVMKFFGGTQVYRFSPPRSIDGIDFATKLKKGYGNPSSLIPAMAAAVTKIW